MKTNKPRIFCKCCGKQTIYTHDNFYRWHLKKEHGITTRQYYDMYLKKEDEDKCPVCGGETGFINMNRGYNRCCSHECMYKDEVYNESRNIGISSIDFNTALEKRKGTCLKKYGVECVSMLPEVQSSIRDTCLQKYGTESTLSLDKVKSARINKLNEDMHNINLKRSQSNKLKSKEASEKRKNTLLLNYGVDYASKISGFRDKMIKTKCEKYGFKSLDEITQFETYRNKVRCLTRKSKYLLFKSFEKCYYTGIVMDLGGCGSKSKTIDHKISIIYGFKNNMSPEQIAHIDNLCVACRFVNSMKNYMTEEEFKKSNKFKEIINELKI